MHLANHLLDTPTCVATAAIAGGALAYGGWKLSRDAARPAAGWFAAVAALVFAAQMINFPVDPGTSGHVIGGVVAATLLGPAAGMFAVFLVLAVQCLLFADGGLAVLGANTLNMAVLPAAMMALVAKFFGERSSAKHAAVVGATAWASVVAAAALCSLEMAASGTFALTAVLGPMLGVHALIGLAEAFLTAAAVVAAQDHTPKPVAARKSSASGFEPRWAVTLGLALAVATALAPLAASSPDGLERVVAGLGLGDVSEPAPVTALLRDYGQERWADWSLATSAAGIIGVAVVFLLGAVAVGGATTFAKRKAID